MSDDNDLYVWTVEYQGTAESDWSMAPSELLAIYAERSDAVRFVERDCAERHGESSWEELNEIYGEMRLLWNDEYRYILRRRHVQMGDEDECDE